MLPKAASLGVILFSGTDVFCCVSPEGSVEWQSDPAASLGEQDRDRAGLGVGLIWIPLPDPPGVPLLWGCAEPRLGLSSPSERQQDTAEAQGWFKATLLPGC